MTVRSIALSTAALVLFSAAAPAPFGFAPIHVQAQEVSADVAAALAGDPAELNPGQLRQRIDTLRSAMDAGTVDERRAMAKMRAYAEALRDQRGRGRERNAEREAQRDEQPGRGAERQQSERERQRERRRSEQERRQEERQAEQERRRQERQAEQERRQEDRQDEQERRQQRRQAEQEQRQQERLREAEQERLREAEQERGREAEQERRREAERERRREAERERQRQAEQERQRQAEQERQRQAEEERQRQAEEERRRQAEEERRRQAEQERRRQERERAEERDRATAAQVAGDDRPASALEPRELRRRIDRLGEAIDTGLLTGDEAQRARSQIRADRDELRSQLAERRRDEPRRDRERTRGEEVPRDEVADRAQRLLRDDSPARRLDDRALRRRLQETRAVLATGRLSSDYERALRQRLREDREEIRSRRSEQAGDERRRDRTSRREPRPDVDVFVERRRPADRLSEEELEHRVRDLQRALRDERMARRDAEIARHIIEQDRRELRQRLRAQRERRREALRHARRDDELNVDFRVEFRPPPVIYAAEAAMEEIEVQLVAPPLYQPRRAYSFQEIVTNHEIRQAMPGIEVDTLNFDFGSAEVRPEEIDKLDTIAEVIERIVTARPDEVFLIEGHTDAVGSDAANLALSRQRAAAVEEALIYYYAIDPANLRTVGLGEHFLRIPTPEPEEENRRVTVRRITPLLAGRG